MALGTLPVARPLENSEITPAGVIRPMRPEVRPSVNHTLPSGPAVMPWDSPPVSPSEYSVTVPAGVMRPMWSEPVVNHRFPSGPAAIPSGLPSEPAGNSVIWPVGLIRPIRPG